MSHSLPIYKPMKRFRTRGIPHSGGSEANCRRTEDGSGRLSLTIRCLVDPGAEEGTVGARVSSGEDTPGSGAG